MSTVFDITLLILGIAVLYWGAEWLIRGSASLARAMGVKPLVIGLTVVAYGTSAPELAVATKAGIEHAQAIALGTVIGSCAANISLILGLTALISPPTVDGRIIRREVPVLVGSAIAVPILLRNGVLSRLEGALLVGCAIVFTIVTLSVSARLDLDMDDEDDSLDDPSASASMLRVQKAEESGVALGGKNRPKASYVMSILMSTLGLILLLAGSALFVGGGKRIAQDLDMSHRMLGLTIVSIGCALPELIGSLVAASRGQSGLAVGSVIGSNLLNVFLVLGVTAYLRPIHLGERMHVVDLVGLVIITLLGVLTLRGSRKITRLEGGVLVLAYVAFIVCCAIF